MAELREQESRPRLRSLHAASAADGGFESVDHGVGIERRGVDVDGVVRGAERGDRAGGVAVVAVEDLREDLVEGEGRALPLEVALPAAGPLVGGGGEEELALGAGKD